MTQFLIQVLVDCSLGSGAVSVQGALGVSWVLLVLFPSQQSRLWQQRRRLTGVVMLKEGGLVAQVPYCLCHTPANQICHVWPWGPLLVFDQSFAVGLVLRFSVLVELFPPVLLREVL